MSNGQGLGFEALILLSLYLLSHILIGYFAFRSGGTWVAKDYFLGGKTTGAVVLFFAMLATKFSGNTFFGLPGRSYRIGLMAVSLIPFTLAISLAFLTYAPRLYVLSKKYDYLTPADYYADRFQSHTLRLCVSVSFILAVIPYLLIQTAAMGHAFVGFSGGQYAFSTGVVYIGTVMLAYVLLSGWRGVVWAEVLQGSLLLGAIVAAAIFVVSHQGGLAAVVDRALAVAPEKVAVPSSLTELTRSYFLAILAFGLGGAMYPQIVQSVYAARSERALRRGLALMLPNYFLILLCVVLIGMVGIVQLDPLGTIEADQVLAQLMGQHAGHAYWLTIFVFLGAAAAVMSTAAGVLLSLSSMLTHDIYRHYLRPQASENEIGAIGRVCTVLILLSVTALSLQPLTTLWQLTIIKFEFLMQLYLPLILGLYWPRFSSRAALAGLLAGILTVAGLLLGGVRYIWVCDPGLCGFAVNAAVAVGLTLLRPTNPAEQRHTQARFFALFSANPDKA